MEKITLKQLTEELNKALETKHDCIRKGQFVFNYMESTYGVAREVQFKDKIDCFYNDSMILAFVIACLRRINDKIEAYNATNKLSKQQQYGKRNLRTDSTWFTGQRATFNRKYCKRTGKPIRRTTTPVD